jgi:N-acetyl-gamma-glutamyl-phosphate reductase
LHAALAAHYADSRLVHVRAAAPRLSATTLNNTDLLELFVAGSETHRQAVLVARLDNLGKGAAGAAVQNLLLMLGLPEEVPPHG